MKKLHNNRGETLVEVLASILIAALSVTLLFSCGMASTQMDEKAEDLDGKHYAALSDADAYASAAATPAPGTVTIVRTDPAPTPGATPAVVPSVGVYGGEGRFSYQAPAATPTPGEVEP